MTTYRERRHASRDDLPISAYLLQQSKDRGWHWIREGMTVREAREAFQKRDAERVTDNRDPDPNSNTSKAFRGEHPVCLIAVRNGALDDSLHVKALQKDSQVEVHAWPDLFHVPVIVISTTTIRRGKKAYRIVCGGKSPDRTLEALCLRYDIKL